MPIHLFVMNFRTPFSFLYPIQLNFLWFIFGVGTSCGLWWEYAVPAKKPWLHLPVFYTLLCSALWKRGLSLGMLLLTERKRKFQPEFIFHPSCMGIDKGCGLVTGQINEVKLDDLWTSNHLWYSSWHKTIIIPVHAQVRYPASIPPHSLPLFSSFRYKQPRLFDKLYRHPETAGRRDRLVSGHQALEADRAQVLLPVHLQWKLLRRKLLQKMLSEGRPIRPLHLHPRRAAHLSTWLEGEILRRT